MSSSLTYKCPTCGAYLEYSPESAKYHCPYCNSDFDTADVAPTESISQDTNACLSEYHCQNCGALVVCGSTTAATRCYFCHSPVILTDRLSEEFAPDGVIPFTVSKEDAQKSFEKFVGKKKFVDSSLLSKNQSADISGIYYPFWIGDFDAAVSFTGEGTRVSSLPSGNYIYTTTKFFNVHLEGKATFRNMVRKALKENEKKMTDSIQPYNFSGMQPFSPGCLSGFSAEMRDVPQNEAKGDMINKVKQDADSMIRSQGSSFSSLKGSSSCTLEKSRMRYVLLPAWIITCPGKDVNSPFYFMMNGQTGKVCGKLPVRWSKLLLVCGGIFAAVFLLLCLGGMFIW